MAVVCAGVGATAIAFGRPVPERPAAAVLAAGSRVSVASKWRTRVDTVKRGEPLLTVLERAGMTRQEATKALLASEAIDARKIRAGTKVISKVGPDSGAAEVVLQLAIDRLVRLTRTSAATWAETEERLAWTTDTVAVGGVVTSTLTAAIAQGAEAFPKDVRAEVAYALADILEYRVDLSRDLRHGDTIRVLMERQRAANGIVRAGAVIAARLTVDGRRVETVRFAQGSKAAYFDGDGKSMRAAFLRAPLAFRRISSVFGMRRHPILGTVRAHQGMDYAAARGTPVRALGDGTVIFAGWKGGYGRVLEIRHRNGFVTRYGHLNGFAAGIRRGASVSISRTVAYVGTTGLSTAPHLHFEVLVNGRHRDPRVALRNVTGEPLAAGQRSTFEQLKTRLFAQLDTARVDLQPTIARTSGD
jgi:murein DD-endopeptidase MepM/ murein hydrolase activator NlpD